MTKDVARRDEPRRSDALTRLDHFSRALSAQEEPGAERRDREARRPSHDAGQRRGVLPVGDGGGRHCVEWADQLVVGECAAEGIE